MDLDAELYSSRCIPLKSAKSFIEKILPRFCWGKAKDEVVLDVGCGPGGTTKELILPLFSSSTRIFAIDNLPDMISLAKKENPNSQIKYSVADIEDWSSLQHLENQITKLISICVFHWLKDQRNSFHNVYRLLQQGGEAAFIFPLQVKFQDSVREIQKSRKWNHLFDGVSIFIPESEYEEHDASYYKKLVEEVGFEVIHCKSEEKIDVFTSEKVCQDFFTSICVLRKYVPKEQLKEFEQDFMETFHKINERDEDGMPLHKGIFMELIVKKK